MLSVSCVVHMLWLMLFVYFFPHWAGGKMPPRSERIVQGDVCTDTQYPYVVSIKAGFQMQHICGGSLIDGLNVLTAGHCGEVKMYVVTGQYDFMEVIGDVFQAAPVTHIFTHPEFGRRGNNPIHDVAVFRLKHRILETNVTKYVTLPKGPAPAPCPTVKVAGWGRTGDDEKPSTRLLCITIPCISRDECQRLYHDRTMGNTICTLDPSGRKGVCYGDSGSPVMCGTEQRGLVSWGVRCSGSSYPGVHTDLSEYLQFIRKSMDSDGTSAVIATPWHVVLLCIVSSVTR